MSGSHKCLILTAEQYDWIVATIEGIYGTDLSSPQAISEIQQLFGVIDFLFTTTFIDLKEYEGDKVNVQIAENSKICKSNL